MVRTADGQLTLPAAAATREQRDEPASERPRSWLQRRAAVVLASGLVVIYACTTILSMRQTSNTFDEIMMSAAGARGYVTGNFDLIVLYHPRLMTYLYGLPVALSRPTYPSEAERDWRELGDASTYARELHFLHGNDGPKLVFRARLVSVAVGAALILLIFGFVRQSYGDVAAVLAAAMAAFVPDLIAHGGIGYNDIPNAAAFFAAVWGLDRAARRPSWKTAVVAGLLVAVAVGVKFSAVALGPIALLLIMASAVSHGREWQAYVMRVLPLLPVAALVVYLALVVLYLGDFTLASFREGLVFNILHATAGNGGVPALLLGERRVGGFWYFFPVAFIIKTPAALHVLLAVALVFLLTRRAEWRKLLDSPLRAPVLAALVFLFFLMRSDLNIGFRHAFPLLPFVVVITAAGVGQLWRSYGRPVRLVIAGLIVIQAATVLSWYPHFIPYTSEYFAHRDLGFVRLSDSSHDWGQGLPLVRQFMEEEGVSSVYLSYFGSAVPEAYGIRHYVPLRSFYELEKQPPVPERPRFIAMSATNLSGAYVADVFADFRQVEPYRVLGHSIFIFEVNR